MAFRVPQSTFGILKIMAAIHISFGLFAGYWDMRLSDALLFSGQMAQIHYYRTLQGHGILGLLAAIAATIFVAVLLHRHNRDEPDRMRLITHQTALTAAYLVFFIFGIKVHLIWLQTHLLDPEGLFWTAVVIAGSALIYFLVLQIAKKIYAIDNSRTVAGAIFLAALILTAGHAYFHSENSKPEDNLAKGKPNILMIVVDTLRADHLTSYNPEVHTTPSLKKFTEESVLFENAIATSPWTTPSHASLFTGQFPSRNGVDGRNIIVDPSSTTLAEVLTRNGYQTAGFMNNVYIRRQTGLSRGFQQYEEFWGKNEGSSLMLLIELITNRIEPRRDSGAEETRSAVRHWLRYDWSGSNPFFLFVHLMEPHAIYGIPDDFYRDFLPAGISPEQARKVNQDPELYICNQLKMDQNDFDILKALYKNDIRYTDNQIDLLLKEFRDKKLIDNTLIIITADHGEHFGEKNLMSHELSVYEELIHVPLVMRFPARAHGGIKVTDIVQTLDLYPSILELSGISKTGLDLQGYSLLPSRMERRNHPAAFAEYDNARAIDKIERRFPGLPLQPLYRRKVLKTARTAEHKYIWGSDGTRELYDIRNDPNETLNLYSSDSDAAAKMQELLSRWVTSFKPSGFYKQEEISKEALEELKALGYVQ